tara:strand:- start:1800 stop:2018 length:219 start_codon:yes stop_codon:yes gene_type:complete
LEVLGRLGEAELLESSVTYGNVWVGGTTAFVGKKKLVSLPGIGLRVIGLGHFGTRFEMNGKVGYRLGIFHDV